MREQFRIGLESGNRPAPRRWLWPLLLLLLAAAAAPRVGAHANGRLQVSNQPIGPFETSVWTVPDPLQAEAESHVTLVLLEPAEPGQTQQGFITDATITVRAWPTGESDAALERPALLGADPDYPLFYESEIFFPAGGEWTIEVEVRHGDVVATRGFAADVNPAPGAGLPWLPIAGGALVVAVAIGLFLARSRPVSAKRAS